MSDEPRPEAEERAPSKREAQPCSCASRPRSAIAARWRALSWPARIAASPLFFYQIVISPLLPANCRFQPTCSAYAIEAIGRHGVLYGGWLAVRRMLRCHPIRWLGGGEGYDPVPPKRPRRR